MTRTIISVPKLVTKDIINGLKENGYIVRIIAEVKED